MKDTNDMPIGKLTRVNDFLPPPEELILKEDNQKITISLSKQSIAFFKKHARKNKSKYQTMIRKVLDAYVSHYDR